MRTLEEKVIDLRAGGSTQSQTARKLYMSQAQVSRIEKGRVKASKRQLARQMYSGDITQTDIALELHVSQPTISRWVSSGRVKRGKDERRGASTAKTYYNTDKTFTQKDLATELNVSQSTVSRRLQGHAKISRSKKPVRNLAKEATQLRKKGLSQQEVAKRMGVSQSTVSRHLRPSTRPPRSRIAGVSPYERARIDASQRKYAIAHAQPLMDDYSIDPLPAKKIKTTNDKDY